MEDTKSCETCNFVQKYGDEKPCKQCKGTYDSGGTNWKPQTRLTRISIRWDNWLDQRKNQITLLAMGIVGFVMILMMSTYMFIATVGIVARLSTELNALTIDVQQLQQRDKGK